MPEKDSYTQGTPCWVDLSTTDIVVSNAFYSALFGWEMDPMDAGNGMTYYMAKLQGKYVAGLMQQPVEQAGAGIPSYWASYISVDNVDETADKVEDAGGHIVFAPDEVPNGGGRMFAASDPTGAQVGFWQAGNHHGAGLVNEPGTLVWNELQTNDVPKAVAFYEAVTGCGSETAPAGDLQEYTRLLVDGQAVAGVMRLPTSGVPPYWMPYFNVDDVDTTVAKAQDLGGRVYAPAFDVPGVGRMAVLADATGAAFSVMHAETA
ncbi:VOC family protein [Arthrobacter sp. M4]|uniref:VOC family protein n=1 Tax=Arthrobacter sp. M4 TaxID=218160 RepID=UPI001CDC7A51|nr:VOC family protein [Arthrobacter sp. M4]MCA4134731.1 VOC family protein [Arthrobacter sp. M4]